MHNFKILQLLVRHGTNLKNSILLTTVGYTNYTSSDDISQMFIKTKPHERADNLLADLVTNGNAYL